MADIATKGPRWYVFQLLPQLQQTAAYHLKEQEFDAFFPRIRRQISKKEFVEEPAFRGYGFVRLDLTEDPWLGVNGTRGVVRLLPAHRQFPIPMPIGWVERWREKDPIDEKSFLDLFEDFFPGMEITYRREGHVYNGYKATVLSIRSRLLEIVFQSKHGTSNSVWISQEDAVPELEKD